MKNLLLGVAAAVLVASGAGAANAQPGYYGQQPSYQHYSNNDRHPGWRQDQGAQHRWSHGDRMGYDDWSSAQRVDYRSHHLRRPPRGYEWREPNGQFILAAVATGLVASIILDNAR